MTEWIDDRLNKDWVIQNNNTQMISKEQIKCFWKPFVYMRRLHDGRKYESDVFPTSFFIFVIDGHIKIRLQEKFILKMICTMNFESYPFDTQVCQLQFTHSEYNNVTI